MFVNINMNREKSRLKENMKEEIIANNTDNYCQCIFVRRSLRIL